MRLEFKARRERKVGFLFFFTIILCTGTAILTYLYPRIFIVSIVAGPVLIFISALIVWIWVDTSYRIDHGVFYYRSGPFRGKISVREISQVSQNRTLTVGKKPALSSGGMVIVFNKYEELYIAPEDKEALTKELLRINPEIKVV